LQVTGGLNQPLLEQLLKDPDEFIRCWAVTLACEDRQPSKQIVRQMVELAAAGDSPRVRLSLASALQRLQGESRWYLAKALASRGEDASDPNLPLMIWYGIEPLIEEDLDRYAELAVTASIPRVRQNMARRIASHIESQRGMSLLLASLGSPDQDTFQRDAVASDVVAGIIEGLEGQRRVTMPDGWLQAYAAIEQSQDDALRRQAIRLAMIFDDQQAIESLRQLAVNPAGAPQHRRQAVEALFERGTDGFGETLIELLDDPVLRGTAIRGLARYGLDGNAEAILMRYADLSGDEKQIALQTLAARRQSAAALLDAMESGAIAASDLTAFTARQLQAFDDEALTDRLSRIWGNVRETPRDQTSQIESLRRMLTPETLAQADVGRGEKLFQKHCATCHQFFGQGGKVGPDITGAQRTNVQYMLENIIDPSASVAKEFRMQMIQTEDGRVLTGLVESESDRALTIVNANERVVIPIDEIEQRKVAEVSVMPNGLLEPLDEREIRDLFGYLQR
jgi:putative heme-binding domain-containing protein